MALFTYYIERMPSYRAVVADVDRAAREAATGARPGREFRHAVWREKKRLLLTRHGIFWRTPAERRASGLRAAAEGVLLALTGGVLGLGAARLHRAGLLPEWAFGTAVAVLLVGAVTISIPAMRALYAHDVWEPWDDGDPTDTETPP